MPMEKPKPPMPPRQVQFGTGEALLTQALSQLEKRPLAELLLKDVAAFNIPKIALSRTWKERWDTATLELSNSGITLLSSLVLPPLVRYPVSKLADLSEYKTMQYLGGEFKTVLPKLAEKNLKPLPAQMARMSASFGFFFPFAAAFWAAPFARNWLTMKRTHSTNFESMIGFEGIGPDGVKVNRPKRTLDEEMAYQRNTALKILGAGAGLGVASLAGFGLMAKHLGKSIGKNLESKLLKQLSTGQGEKAFQQFFKAFDLKGNQVNGRTATLMFWGLPAYLGWVHGARSGNERRERVVQSANAIFWFFFASRLTTPLWRKGYQQLIQGNALNTCKKVLGGDTKTINAKLLDLSYEDILTKFKHDTPVRKKLLGLKNAKFALNDLGIPISTLSAVQFFNFNLTEKKIKNTQSQSKAPQLAPTPTPVVSPLALPVASQPFAGGPQPAAWGGYSNWG